MLDLGFLFYQLQLFLVYVQCSDVAVGLHYSSPTVSKDVTFDLIVPFLGQYLHSLATLIGTPFKYHVGPLLP